MIKEKLSLERVHFDHRIWNNELDFVKDEVNIYEKRLSDLVQKDYNRDMMRGLEHFQNQFIRQKEVIDELHHKVNTHEHHIVEITISQASDKLNPLFEEYLGLSDEMETFRKIFQQLKKEFYQYLAKWK